MGEWESFGHEEGAEEEYPKFPGCVHSSVQQKECPAVGRDHVFMGEVLQFLFPVHSRLERRSFSGKGAGQGCSGSQGLVEDLILGCKGQNKNSKVFLLKERVVLGLFPWDTNTSQRKKWAGKAVEKSQ